MAILFNAVAIIAVGGLGRVAGVIEIVDVDGLPPCRYAVFFAFICIM